MSVLRTQYWLGVYCEDPGGKFFRIRRENPPDAAHVMSKSGGIRWIRWLRRSN